MEGSQGALDGIVATPAPQHLVFRNVTVWDGLADHDRPGVYVEVREGRIASGSSIIRARPRWRCRGRRRGQDPHARPIDTHVHLMFDSGSLRLDGDRRK